MQIVKCRTCRKIAFFYDGDATRESLLAAKVTYPDGSKPEAGKCIIRKCGHGRIFKRPDTSLYVDGEIETPTVTLPSEESIATAESLDRGI